MATMIIEGERAQAASGDTYEVRNPATGEVVDRVPSGGEADVDRAAKAARKAFPSWSKLAPAERAKILHKAAAHMLARSTRSRPCSLRSRARPFWSPRSRPSASARTS